MATYTTGTIRKGTLSYIITPHFSQNFRADMNSIGATWGPVGGEGAWIFKPGHLAQVKAWAQTYFPESVAQPAALAQLAPLTDKEQFAVAMGLGIIAQEDLS